MIRNPAANEGPRNVAAGAISEDELVSADGNDPRFYTFTTTEPPGTAYTVSITTQSFSQMCTLSNASGTVASKPVDNINLICVAGPTDLIWNDGAWDGANWQ